MRTLRDYTPEIREKVAIYKQRVRDTYQMPFNREASKAYIQLVYKVAGRKAPKVFFANNRLEYAMLCVLAPKIMGKPQGDSIKLRSELCSELHSELDSELHSELDSELCSELHSELDLELDRELRFELCSELHSELCSELCSELHSELDLELCSELRSELRSELDSELRSELNSELQNTKSYWLYLCSAYQSVFLTWYWFISKEFSIEHKSKQRLATLYKLSLKAHIGRCFFNPHYVIVLKRPNVHFVGSQLHSEDSAAVDYHGTKRSYYWKGVPVTQKLIETPEQITKQDLQDNQNAEVRRAFIEKLGVSKYFEILSDGKGLEVLDEDEDKQGYPMRLMQFDFEGDKIQVLECTCPSTKRAYNIYPPNQRCTNVWEAKASTFNAEKIFVRHGDVGLVKEGYEGEPQVET